MADARHPPPIVRSRCVAQIANVVVRWLRSACARELQSLWQTARNLVWALEVLIRVLVHVCIGEACISGGLVTWRGGWNRALHLLQVDQQIAQTRQRLQQLRAQLHSAQNYGCDLMSSTNALDAQLQQIHGHVPVNPNPSVAWKAHC